MQAKELLSLEVVADELSITYEQARRLCAIGRLPYINVGTSDERKQYRVRRDTLEAFKRNEQREHVTEEIKNVRNALAAASSVEEYW